MKESRQSQNKMVVAFAWYRPEQWQRVRDISAAAAGADALEGSDEEWLRLAEEKLKELRSFAYVSKRLMSR